eukprot:3734313-Amphidinium_carterae.1
MRLASPGAMMFEHLCSLLTNFILPFVTFANHSEELDRPRKLGLSENKPEAWKTHMQIAFIAWTHDSFRSSSNVPASMPSVQFRNLRSDEALQLWQQTNGHRAFAAITL